MNVTAALRLTADALGENGLADEWSIGLNNHKRTLGLCYHADKKIELSRHLIELNDVPVVQDIIWHEVAHALVGHAEGHGQLWKMQASRLGANPMRINHTAVMPDAPWKGYCRHGKLIRELYRKPRSLNYSCLCAGQPLAVNILVFVNVNTGETLTSNNFQKAVLETLTVVEAAHLGLRVRVT